MHPHWTLDAVHNLSINSAAAPHPAPHRISIIICSSHIHTYLYLRTLPRYAINHKWCNLSWMRWHTTTYRLHGNRARPPPVLLINIIICDDSSWRPIYNTKAKAYYIAPVRPRTTKFVCNRKRVGLTYGKLVFICRTFAKKISCSLGKCQSMKYIYRGKWRMMFVLRLDSIQAV